MRVGVITDADPVFDDWEVRLFDALQADPSTSLTAVHVLPDRAPEPVRSPALKAVLAMEQRIPVPSSDVKTPLSRSLLATVKELKAPARAKRVDVWLCHARQGLPAGFNPGAAEVWGYSVQPVEESVCKSASGKSPTGAPATEISLVSLGEQPRLIASARTNVKATGLYTDAFAHDLFPTLVRKTLRQTPNRGPVPPVEVPPAPQQPRQSLRSRFMQTSRHLADAAGHRVGRKLGLQTNAWSLALGQGDPLTCGLDQLVELPQPANEYRADPFLFAHESGTYVFFEAFGPAFERGELRVGRLKGDEIVDVVPLNFGKVHVSFPFVFAHDGEIYMMPETHERGRVEVWRCVAFPDNWVLHATALEGCAPADSVVFEHGGAWWLFTSIGSGAMPDHCRELHVFQVNGPDLSGLTPHALNPVVLDTTCARMGGRPFVREGRLIRPGQNSSYGRYGYGLALMEVIELTLTHYAERPLRRIQGAVPRGTTGCHHIDVLDDRFILDVRRSVIWPLVGGRPIALEAT